MGHSRLVSQNLVSLFMKVLKGQIKGRKVAPRSILTLKKHYKLFSKTGEKRNFFVSVDATSLGKNTTKGRYWNRVYTAYEFSTKKTLLFLYTHCLWEMLRLIIIENYFQFQVNGKCHLQIHSTMIGTKTAVSFANVFMAYIETQIPSKQFKTVFKRTVWKHYMYIDIFVGRT